MDRSQKAPCACCCLPSYSAAQNENSPLALGGVDFSLPSSLSLSLSFQTTMIGKWHLGWPTWAHWPTSRGFDEFYGFMNGEIDYWNKTWNGFLDLQDNNALVTDPVELTTHAGSLMSQKAIAAMRAHEDAYSSRGGNRVPMFLYYAPALVHSPWEAPVEYLEKCGGFTEALREDSQRIHHYCAMILMLEESVSNITCTLQELGWANNTVMVVLSDNGGDSRNIPGSNAPLRGSKNTLWNGGVRANCFIHSELIPLRARGAKFEGLSHITDWLPTLMHVATNNTWSGTRINGEPVDGVDLWDTLISCQRGETATNYYSPRGRALVNWDEENYEGMMIYR